MKIIKAVPFIGVFLLGIMLQAHASVIKIDYSGTVISLAYDAYQIKYGDTITGTIIYESETPPDGGLSNTSDIFDNAILESYFSFLNSSGVYLQGTVVPGAITLENSSGITPNKKDTLATTQMPFTGDTIGYNRFEGDPLTYHPLSFKLSIWELVGDVLSEGFVSDVHHLPTDILFENIDGGFINIDWKQTGGARFYATMQMTSLKTSPVPEPATIILLGSGLVGIAGIGRKKIKK